MTLADARALVPDLTAVPAAPEADALALAALAGWCGRYSPWSAPDGEDGVRLDITGCAHLFGGEAALLADAVRRLEALGFAARGAVADTPAAAWGLARHRPRQEAAILPPGESAPLLGLPVAALRIAERTAETLIGLGLTTVGAVAALPRAPLALRLGETLLERLDMMFGRLPEPISPAAPAETWRAGRLFAEPIGRREDIDAATLDLAERLCRDLARAGRGARRLELGFHRVDATVQRLVVGTSRPSHAPGHVLRLFAERLEEVDPGFGIEVMVLEATVTEPLAPRQAGLSDADSIDPADLAALIDRLRNRLGPERVTEIVPIESHMPERAEKITSPLEGEVGPRGRVRGRRRLLVGTVKAAPAPSPDNAARCRPLPQGERYSERKKWTPPAKSPRPPKLLAFPEPIEAMAPVPDDPPLSFRWRRVVHRVAAADGPERIGPEWWLPAAPRKPRDYYRVEDAQGRRFWLYREGLYDGPEPPRWFLHGFFA